jgi:hypothetical protein
MIVRLSLYLTTNALLDSMKQERNRSINTSRRAGVMANVVRWDPFGEMLSLRQAMDRLMEDAWVRPSTAGNTGPPAQMAEL